MGPSPVGVNAVDDHVQCVEGSGDFECECGTRFGGGVGLGLERDVARGGGVGGHELHVLVQVVGVHRTQDLMVSDMFHPPSVGVDNDLSVGFGIAGGEEWGGFLFLVVHCGEPIIVWGGVDAGSFRASGVLLSGDLAVGGAKQGTGTSVCSRCFPFVLARQDWRGTGWRQWCRRGC